MRKEISLAVLASVVSIGDAHAEDAKSILEEIRARQVARWNGVKSYVVDQSMAGHRIQQYFERVEVTDDAGNSQVAFVPARAADVERRRSGEEPDSLDVAMQSGEAMDAYAGGLEMTGEVMGEAIEDGLADAGLPRGLLRATGSDPWATFDPRVMFGGMAVFARGAADAQRERAAHDPSADVRADVESAQKFLDAARLVGEEKASGRRAFHIRAEELGIRHESDGQVLRIDSIDLFIDKDRYVPLRLVMEGEATSDGESRPIRMEKEDLDYAPVPGTDMLEPRRQVMRIGGVLTKEQKKEMEEAQVKLAEFEKQLEEMPAAQRDMVRRTMGSQMETMRKMVSSGAMEVVTEVHDIRVLERTSDG